MSTRACRWLTWSRYGIPLLRHAAEFGWAWVLLIARRVTGAVGCSTTLVPGA
jgi:hypothetical protein